MGFFAELLCRLWATIPRPVLRWLGSWIGILWFDILRFRRRIVLGNLELAFPESSPAWRRGIGRESLRRAGANFFEFFTLPVMDEEWIRENAVIEGWENVEEARRENKGVLLLSLHMGAYDLAASLIVQKGLEVHLISKFFRTQWFNDLWFSIRGAKGVRFIDPHGPTTAFDILKALKKKAGVIFVIDQYMGRPFGIRTKFFGVETGTAYGLALFRLKTGAPVIPVYSREGEDGKLHLVFESKVDLSAIDDTDKDAAVLAMTQTFNDVIEAIVRRHPEEWLWVHRRWKNFDG